jgi:hypothetical protein
MGVRGLTHGLRSARAAAMHDDGDAFQVHPAHHADEARPGHRCERDFPGLAYQKYGFTPIEDVVDLEVEGARQHA